MIPFNNLSAKENKALLTFPAYISLLAANNDGILDEAERESAIKFSHTKTFSCEPLLVDFYEEADKVFENSIIQIDSSLPKGKERREAAIKKKLSVLENIVLKLGEDNIFAMHRSMKSFKEHVSKAHHNVLVDFIFPIPIIGITEY